MTQTSWVSLINNEQFNQINNGSTLSNSGSLTDISAGGNTSGQALTIPANYLYQGMQLRASARGIYSTTGTTTLLLGIYFGGVAGTALASSTFGASANASNAVWSLDADIRIDGTGTSATVRTFGKIWGATSYGWVMLPQTTAGGGVSIATGSSSILTLGAQWGTGASGNSITCYDFLVEQLN